MKDLLREARRFARLGDFSRAGDLCDMAGHPLDAIAYYVQGKHYLLAGQVAERIGEHGQAASYFSNGGDAVQAAEMYLRAGQKKKAAVMFEHAGLYLRAAELEERMGNHPAAAGYYEMGGQLEKAAFLYAQGGDPSRAADLYEKLLAAEAPALDSGAFNLEEARRRKARFARFAGILHLKAGHFKKAAPFLEEAGLLDQAVLAWRKAGETERAARLLIQLENFTEALRLLEDDPAARIEGKLLGELYLRSGQFERAAEVFLREGLSFRAAECFESSGDLARAASLFAAEGELLRAGDLFSGIGRHREAAAAYEKAAEFINAGRAYEKAGLADEAARVWTAAGRPLESARLYLARGDQSQAIRVLQSVRRDDNDFGRASLELGSLFLEQGLYAPAAGKFENAMRLLQDENEKIRCLYKLALAYEQMGRIEEACRFYERILSVDYHHADVADRVKSLARQVAPQVTSNSSSQRAAIRQDLGGPSATPPHTGSANSITGRLEMTRQIGSGRYSVIFEAYDRALQKKVAARRFPPKSSGGPDMVDRFLREARRASELSHPSHVTVFGTGEDSQGRWILEELVEGRTLREMLDEKIRLEPARVIEMATQTCDLLMHAHRKGILHRDLRPEKIYVLARDQVKVLGFGLKVRLGDPTAPQDRSICYVSPEALRSERVDERSDIYSFGIVLYELLMGTPPYPPDTASFDHINTPPPFPARVDRMIPGFLKRIVERCLEKDRSRRYRSAAQVLDDLKASVIVPGAVIAERYEVIKELGIGGMGRIYQALDRDLDESVAIKVLRASDADGRHMERFLREIKMTRKISHPNVVKVYDLGTWREHKYITMEYIDGLNLEQWVRLKAPIELAEAVRVMVAVALGLESAHALGIIHRDIKPQNILLKDGTTPKVLDFGIARGSDNGEMTTAGFVMGSPKYMSPEQVQAQPLDIRTDVYSLGIVMYFVFTGREPFVGDSPSVIAYKHIGEAPRPLREVNPAVPAWLDTLVLKALSKKREDRFATMREVADALSSGMAATGRIAAV